MDYRWPGYLAPTQPLGPAPGWVPNQQSVGGPAAAQFAPDYLPPGSMSFQPFNWDPKPVRPKYYGALVDEEGEGVSPLVKLAVAAVAGFVVWKAMKARR